jgi:hypothetical protein
MDEKPASTRFAVTAALPIIAVQLCLAPFWLTRAYARPGGDWLPFAGMLLTGLLAPIYLATLGCRLAWRREAFAVFSGFAVLVAALALDFFLDYALWGIGSGQFSSPDAGTIEIMQIMACVAIPVFAAPPLGTILIRYACFRADRA